MGLESITIGIALFIGLISVWLMLMQQRLQIRQETRDEFRLLAESIKDLKECNQKTNSRIDRLEDKIEKLDDKIDKINSDLLNKIDSTNSRIDRLTDAIYSQKAG